MSELPVNPYHVGDPSATAVTATGALLTGRVPPPFWGLGVPELLRDALVRRERHQKIDQAFAALQKSVENEFESLRRSIGQKFRWARYENERETFVVRQQHGLVVFSRRSAPKC